MEVDVTRLFQLIGEQHVQILELERQLMELPGEAPVAIRAMTDDRIAEIREAVE